MLITVKFRDLVFAVAALIPATIAQGQEVSLTMRDGIVTLDAKAASVPQILKEWARIGGVHVVNGDKVPGVPITVQLAGTAERDALAVILRGASGYVLAARSDAGKGAAIFDRILILPTSSPVSAAPPPRLQPMVGRPPVRRVAPMPAGAPPFVGENQTEESASDGIADVESPGLRPIQPGVEMPFVPQEGVPPAAGGMNVISPLETAAQTSAPTAGRNLFFNGAVGSGQPGAISPPPPPADPLRPPGVPQTHPGPEPAIPGRTPGMPGTR